MMKKGIIKTLAFGAIIALAFTACNDQWNEHYQVKEEHCGTLSPRRVNCPSLRPC